MFKKLILLICLVLTLALANSASALSDSDPNLLAWYKLNGDPNDSSVNKYNGKASDTVEWVDDEERGTKVASFNGDDAYIETPIIMGAFPQDRDFTWAFWYKFNAATVQYDTILGNRSGGDDELHFTKFTMDEFEFYRDAQNNVMVDYNDFTAGQWCHNVVVKDGTTLTYYRDGKKQLSETISFDITDANNPFYIGGDPNANNEFAAGEISDVSLWNKALTTDEVSDLYENGISSESDDSAREPNPDNGAVTEVSIALVERRVRI